MNRYGPKAQHHIEKTIKSYEKGTLKSGRSGRVVTNRKQAIAIGIETARKKHYKVPTIVRKASHGAE